MCTCVRARAHTHTHTHTHTYTDRETESYSLIESREPSNQFQETVGPFYIPVPFLSGVSSFVYCLSHLWQVGQSSWQGVAASSSPTVASSERWQKMFAASVWILSIRLILNAISGHLLSSRNSQALLAGKMRENGAASAHTHIHTHTHTHTLFLNPCCTHWFCGPVQAVLCQGKKRAVSCAGHMHDTTFWALG